MKFATSSLILALMTGSALSAVIDTESAKQESNDLMKRYNPQPQCVSPNLPFMKPPPPSPPSTLTTN